VIQVDMIKQVNLNAALQVLGFLNQKATAARISGDSRLETLLLEYAFDLSVHLAEAARRELGASIQADTKGPAVNCFAVARFGQKVDARLKELESQERSDTGHAEVRKELSHERSRH